MGWAKPPQCLFIRDLITISVCIAFLQVRRTLTSGMGFHSPVVCVEYFSEFHSSSVGVDSGSVCVFILNGGICHARPPPHIASVGFSFLSREREVYWRNQSTSFSCLGRRFRCFHLGKLQMNWSHVFFCVVLVRKRPTYQNKQPLIVSSNRVCVCVFPRFPLL